MTPQQRWVLALTSAGSCMTALDATVVVTALATIGRRLGASLAALEWTVTGYSLAFAVLLLTGSALGDRLGRRRVFTIGVAVFTTASAGCALAPGAGWLIAARVVQGAGAALILPLALTQLSAAFPPAQRGRALGVFSGLNGLAVFAGPLIGGGVAQGLPWQWIFWVNVPVGIALMAASRRLAETRGPRTRFDLVGVVLGGSAAFALVWGLVRGNPAGWRSAEVVWMLLLGLALTALFIGWESRSPAAMLPMRMFANRTFAAANVANACLYISLQGSLFLISQYLQVALGQGPLGAGLRLMAWTGTLMVCGPLVGRWLDRAGERRFIVAGLSVNAAGLAGLALLVSPVLGYPRMVVALVVSGCGLCLAMPAVQKAVVGAVPPALLGPASGALNAVRTLGGAFGVAILAAVFASRGGTGSPAAFSSGLRAALAVAALVSLAGAAVGLLLPSTAAATVPAVGPAPVLPQPGHRPM